VQFGGARPPRPAPDPTTRPPHLLGSELALVGITAAALFGFARLFESFEFLWPLLALAAGIHLLTAVLRRKGVGIAWSFLAVSGGWALGTTWLYFRETTFALLPTPTTLDAAGIEFDRAWSAFRELAAPAPALTGFVLAIALAVGVTVFLADWAAFRMWSTRDAIVPSLTLFVFATLLAGGAQRVTSGILYVTAVLVFVLLHRVARLERSGGWVGSARATGGNSLLRIGLVIALVAAVLGAVVGPRLPGADELAIVDWRGNESSTGRVTVSPLVDIRSRLVEQSETEVFQVRSELPSYWRMTALDDFDGNIWRSTGTYDQVTGSLPVEQRFPARSTDILDQDFLLQGLSTLWLPAALQPLAIDSTIPVRYQPETSTLIVDPEAPNADGAAYSVRSAIMNLAPDQLRSADPGLPTSIIPMLELPSDFSESARATAEEVVRGAANRYDQALALQDFFRDSGGFVYDLDVDSGHSGDAIEDFLEKRRGYCEQFAGTFAAMARSVGIPARVAVGFTWGDTLDDQPGVFQVRGRNAHAWPEVYLGGYGWVAFEPTPGRGAPNAESYTGQPPSQENAATAPEASPATTAAPSPTTTTPTDAEATPNQQAAELLRTEDAAGPRSTDSGSGLPRLATVLVLLGAAVIGYLVVVPGGRTRRRRRRRHLAMGSPPAEVAVAWNETTEHLALLHLEPRPDETHNELARRAGAALPTEASALTALADAADAATYGPDQVDETVSAASRADADRVIGAVDARVPRWRRALALLDPRTSTGSTAAPRRHSAGRPRD